MKLYSKEKKSLLFVEQKATPGFWDKHWKTDELARSVRACTDAPFYTHYLKKYLHNEKGIILEGGCGKGELVYAFKSQGFNPVGIDFAKKTVEQINKAVPEIDVRFGDVRNLPFKDNEIAGYWSLGVIEHFWEGYDAIFSEMSRVVRPGGYLFLAFPYMSPLRKLKALCAQYELDDAVDGEKISERFYQFALNQDEVTRTLAKFGFFLREKTAFDGIKGLKDEIRCIRKTLQKLYDYNGNNRVVQTIKIYVDRLLKPFASHCALLILQKSQKTVP